MGAFDNDDAAKAFSRIHHCLKQISRGSSFCEDRGFGWTMENEMKEGRDFIAEAFAAFPELGQLMPGIAEALSKNILLADATGSGEVSATADYFRARRPREAPPASPPVHGFALVDAAEAMRRIFPDLRKIQELASYCHDQGYSWDVAREHEIGRAAIAEAFAAHPRLRELMPARAATLAEGLPLGDALDWDELDAAKVEFGIDQPKPRRKRRSA